MKVLIGGISDFYTNDIRVIPIPAIRILDFHIVEKNEILIGDRQGVDTAVQQYLKIQGYKNVTVYCSNNKCRNLLDPDWKVKDKVMMEDADCGFFIWDGKSIEISNNIKVMKEKNKHTIVFRIDINNFNVYNGDNYGKKF